MAFDEILEQGLRWGLPRARELAEKWLNEKLVEASSTANEYDEEIILGIMLLLGFKVPDDI